MMTYGFVAVPQLLIRVEWELRQHRRTAKNLFTPICLKNLYSRSGAGWSRWLIAGRIDARPGHALFHIFSYHVYDMDLPLVRRVAAELIDG